MTSIRFNPPGMWSPDGRAFSQGVVQSPGRVVHITGQVAWDAEHQIVGEHDVARQLQQCIENTGIILASAGGVLEDIVSLTIYFLHRDDLPVIQAVRSQYFAPQTAPVSILIQVAGLVLPEFLVELVPIAVIPEERFRAPV